MHRSQARLFMSSHTIGAFPYKDAAKLWLERSEKRGRYMLGSN
jgi:hypothetical protein